MVSIPDWTRFQRSQIFNNQQPPRAPLNSRERYERSLEVQALREAESKGYFLKPTRENILRDFGLDESRNKDASSEGNIMKVKVIQYISKHLKSLGDIEVFTKVQVLMLGNNYLEDISELAACRELVKLDLHSNQLSHLHDAMLWSQLPKLQLLLLHDNPIARVDIVHALSLCPRLYALTLYDTPLSLKKNYRHHVVNSICSLKALDRHVVSDEEIIEDAVFRGTRFAALASQLVVNLSQRNPEDETTSGALSSVIELMAKINKIASNYCPVLVIQKFARGWLVRRRLHAPHHKRYSRMPAAVQASWRMNRQLPVIAGSAPSRYRPTEVLQQRATTSFDSIHVTPSSSFNVSGGNRPLLKPLPEVSLHVDVSRLEESIAKVLGRESGDTAANEIVADAASKPRVRKNYDASLKPISRRNMDVKHFLGEVVNSGDSLDGMEEEAGLEGDSRGNELPLATFRLRGMQQGVELMEPIELAMLARKNAGQDIRDMAADAHGRLAALPHPRALRSFVKVKDRFMFMRLHETMSLSCLQAVHEAYKDRELEEAAAMRTEATMSMRQRRERGREAARAFCEEKRQATLKQSDTDRKHALEAEEKQQLDSLHDFTMRKERRLNALTRKGKRKADLAFINEFRTQQTSVSKALLKHDWQSRRDSVLNERAQTVASAKDMLKEKQHIIRKYMEHRSLLRQTENSVSKAAIDNRIMRSTSEHLIEVKSRVVDLKTRKHHTPLPFPVPNVTMSIPSVPSAPNATPDIRSDFRSTSESRAGGLAMNSVNRGRLSRLLVPA